MIEKDWKRFSELIDAAAEYYRQPHLTNAAMKLMFEALRYLSFEAVSLAVTKHMSGIDGNTSRFCPNAADLRLALYGTPEQQACEAWVNVVRAMRKLRSGTSVRFDNPAYHFAIEACGGWPGLCRMTPEESEPLFRRHFVAGIHRCIGWHDVPDHMYGSDEANGYASWTPDEIKFVATRSNSPEALQIASAGA
ncbi:hypothetical protein [Pyramidobacter piscolens]|uniref:hypothetical protein n=1 Tax=Pyramidobacter piscolens TaxID=638849 RepID=UPI002AB012DE|nr:hypothetical protein [Pyramidobacter piscolens]